MTDHPKDVPVERIPVETEAPGAAIAAALADLVPGAVVDGVVDPMRIAEAAGLPIAGAGGVERFGLMWAGKAAAVEALQAPSMAALAPDMENSINWDTAENVFIEGDNLEVLKLLQKAYNDQVKLIYIDPPYNTGNDFVYNDDFSQPLKHYLEVTGQVDSEGNRLVANTEVSGRKHSNWLSMMYPRLVLARNLLADDGLMALSIDENELVNLVAVLDEVFGESSRLGIVAVVNNLKGRSDAEHIATAHEYLILYSRSRFRTLGLPLPPEIQETYKLMDAEGKSYRLLPLRKSGTSSLRQDRPNMFFPLFVEPTTGKVALEEAAGWIKILPLFPDGREGRWRWGADTAARKVDLLVGKLMASGRYDIQVIDYMGEGEDERRAKPKSVWLDPKFTSDLGTYQVKEILGEGVFSHPKPLGLISEILEFAIEPGDIVMDLFAGSGTTGHAVQEWNLQNSGEPAKYVLINLPEEVAVESAAHSAGFATVAEITRARLKAFDYNGNGARSGGLRAFRLSPSSFVQTLPSADSLLEDTLDPAASDVDIASEVFLKAGLRLDHEWLNLDDLDWAHRVCHDTMVVLARTITDEIVQDCLKLPAIRTLIFLEDAFAGRDAVKVNAYHAFKQANKIMKTM